MIGSAIIAFGSVLSAQQTAAVAGNPFGVGEIRVKVPAAKVDGLTESALMIYEKDGRVRYPVITVQRPGPVLETLFGGGTIDGSREVVCRFLFEGDEPLAVTFFAPDAIAFRVEPMSPAPDLEVDREPLPPPATLRERRQRRLEERRDRRQDASVARTGDALMQAWWSDYCDHAAHQIKMGDYPPVVETYLTSMLAGRLGLIPTKPLQDANPAEGLTPPQQSIDLLLATDRMRADMLRRCMQADPALRQPATLPLPQDIDWMRPRVPAVDAVEVEPLAMHVPRECYYLRFGRFNNYLWFNRLLEDYGGDIARMATLRGHDARLNEKTQKQLGLKQSALAEIFGEQVIADVAIIGRDMYMLEGPATGILFQAKNNLMLTNDLRGQQRTAVNENKASDASIRTVKIAGRDVSFASTPDNRLRSFYAQDGEFHLVTTSRAIVERFFQAGEGSGALGSTPEFRHARDVMPTSRADTVFAYFSPYFFEGLLSPHYRIELKRRLQAAVELELIQLAQMAAQGEGRPSDTLGDLIAGGFLPQEFGQRTDGSFARLIGDELADSRRTGRGTFIPIPDMDVGRVSIAEATDYDQVASFHSGSWPQMDPLAVGVKRYALDGERMERIVIDAKATPFSADKYGILTSVVGPPLANQMSPVPGDIISAQAVIRGGLLFPDVGVHHLFVGVQDTDPVGDISNGGILTWLRLFRTTPSYLGAWPKPGYFDRLTFGLIPPPDEFGFTKLLFGLWRREIKGMSVFSFSQPLLAHVTERIGVEKTENAAQVRVRVGDLSQARITSMTNALAYQRARQASLGNARLLNLLSQQMRLPREQARSKAESLLQAHLICSVGGNYELMEEPGGLKHWVSTAWKGEAGARRYTIPADYQSPTLEWFRGVNVDAVLDGSELLAHAELDMKRKPQDKPKMELPKFNLGNLFGGFGGGKEPAKTAPDKESGDAGDASPEPIPTPQPRPIEF